MPLAPLVGHGELRARLSSAIAADALPQVLLVTGPPGVGKQRLSLWLAQRLLCLNPGVEPCGTCSGCTRVMGLAHPDLHWFVPIPRPKAGEPAKQMDEVSESLEGIMAERRATPLWTAPDGMSAHGIASARLLQHRASYKAAEGGWRVFIIGRADRLVAQDSSQEAANALLKLLEEPPPRTLFVLTTAEPGLVLPTIRSRAVPVRVGRLTDAELRGFLTATKPELATDAVISRSHGSIGAAVTAEHETRAKAVASADAFIKALGVGPTAAAERTLKQGPWAARGEFTALLDALAERLAEDARSALLQRQRVPIGNPAAKLAGVERVLAARERAQGNINPQLLLAVLGDELVSLGAA